MAEIPLGVKIGAFVLLWVVGFLVFYLVNRQITLRRRMRERALELDEPRPYVLFPEEEEGFLTRWLLLAGFRGPHAAKIFVLLTMLAICVGLLAVYMIRLSGIPARAIQLLGTLPSGFGDIFIPLVYIIPWAAFLIIATLPWVVVRRARRRRVQEVEEDLPVTLDLLATLCEAGLGFDAAIVRILESQPGDRNRTLSQEFRLYQLETLAGRPRVQCLRRMARRLDVTSFTISIAALVQADQIGAGVADVLRRQADDLRSRRREQANTMASALPVKLMFPLIICFLPGIFVVTLGPTFYQFFQLIDQVIQNRIPHH
jgi:pilus assembly protein TadC